MILTKFVQNIEHTEQQVIGTVDIVVPKDIAATDEEALNDLQEIKRYEKLLVLKLFLNIFLTIFRKRGQQALQRHLPRTSFTIRSRRNLLPELKSIAGSRNMLGWALFTSSFRRNRCRPLRRGFRGTIRITVVKTATAPSSKPFKNSMPPCNNLSENTQRPRITSSSCRRSSDNSRPLTKKALSR